MKHRLPRTIGRGRLLACIVLIRLKSTGLHDVSWLSIFQSYHSPGLSRFYVLELMNRVVAEHLLPMEAVANASALNSWYLLATAFFLVHV